MPCIGAHTQSQGAGTALTLALPSDAPTRRVAPATGSDEAPMQIRVMEVRRALVPCLRRKLTRD